VLIFSGGLAGSANCSNSTGWARCRSDCKAARSVTLIGIKRRCTPSPNDELSKSKSQFAGIHIASHRESWPQFVSAVSRLQLMGLSISLIGGLMADTLTARQLFRIVELMIAE